VRLLLDIDLLAPDLPNAARLTADVLVHLTEDLPGCLPPTWCTMRSDYPQVLQRLRRMLNKPGGAAVAGEALALYDEDYY